MATAYDPDGVKHDNLSDVNVRDLVNNAGWTYSSPDAEAAALALASLPTALCECPDPEPEPDPE